MRIAGLSLLFATLSGCAINSWETDYIVLPQGEVHVVAAPAGLTFLPPDHWTRYFPARARDQGLSGRGTVRCRVGAGGAIEACVPTDEHPTRTYLSFADAARRIALRAKADPQILSPGADIELTFEFLAHSWIDLDCDITVTRVADDCRVRKQVSGGLGLGERVARAAEGRPPPNGIDAMRPGRARWRVVEVIPIEDGP